MWPYLEIDSECLLGRMQVGRKLRCFGDAWIFTFNTATFLLELVKWYIGTAALAHWSNGDFGHDGSTSRNWAWGHRGQRCGTTIGRNWNVRQFLLLHQAWLWGYWIRRSPGLEGYQLLRSHFQKARPKIAKSSIISCTLTTKSQVLEEDEECGCQCAGISARHCAGHFNEVGNANSAWAEYCPTFTC